MQRLKYEINPINCGEYNAKDRLAGAECSASGMSATDWCTQGYGLWWAWFESD